VELADRVTVFPAGRSLPASFYDPKAAPFGESGTPACFAAAEQKCVALFVELEPKEAESILFLDSGYNLGRLFQQDPSGQWRETGELNGAMFCDALRSQFASGAFKLVPHPWPDIVVGDQRLAIVSNAPACPPAALAAKPAATPLTPRR
jgi:hypothetical protein